MRAGITIGITVAIARDDCLIFYSKFVIDIRTVTDTLTEKSASNHRINLRILARAAITVTTGCYDSKKWRGRSHSNGFCVQKTQGKRRLFY